MPIALNPADRLPTSLKAGWGFGSVGTVAVINVTSLLLLYFMIAVLGIAPALAGALLFGTKLFDAAAAPLLGTISDRTHSRMGRRRPFLLAGAFVCGIAIATVFNPPSFISDAMLPAYLLGGLLLLALGYTLFNVPYLTMPVEMTDSPAERTSIMSWRIGFVSFGGLLTGVAPQVAVALGGGRVGYGRVGLMIGLLVCTAMLVAFRASRTARRTVAEGPGDAGFRRFAVVLGNRPFMLVLAAKVLQLVGIASMSASVLFFIKDVIGGTEKLVSLYVLTSTIASILSMPLWVALGRRFSKRNLYIAACLGFGVAIASWLLAGMGEPLPLVLLRGAAVGALSGGLLLMGQSLLPDTIDYDCRRSGVRREGVYAGAYSFVEKASSAIGPLLVGLILQSFGFVASKGGAVVEQSASAIEGIYVGASILPALLYTASVVPLLFYSLTPEKLRAAGSSPVPASS